jgi:hypothetical protein
MYIPQLDSSCKYYSIGAMVYLWAAPEDIEEDSVFRLKLTTDVPPTTHFSGKLRLSHADAASSLSMPIKPTDIAGCSVIKVVSVACVVVLSLLLTCWMTVRLRRRLQRIILE